MLAQSITERGAPGDAELAEYTPQVGLDRARRQRELDGNVFCGRSCRGEFSDPLFLCGERVGFTQGMVERVVGGSKFGLRPAGPGVCT